MKDSSIQPNKHITPTGLSGKTHSVVIDRLEWEEGGPVLHFRLIARGLPITEADIERRLNIR